MLALGSGLEGADDEDHELFAKGEDFVVVVLDSHFEIKARKLGYWLVNSKGCTESTLAYFCKMSLCI